MARIKQHWAGTPLDRLIWSEPKRRPSWRLTASEPGTRPQAVVWSSVARSQTS